MVLVNDTNYWYSFDVLLSAIKQDCHDVIIFHKYARGFKPIFMLPPNVVKIGITSHWAYVKVIKMLDCGQIMLNMGEIYCVIIYQPDQSSLQPCLCMGIVLMTCLLLLLHL